MGRKSRSQPSGKSPRSSSSYIGDKRLIPRIKEYIKENDGHMLEADELATALQAEYSEYSRKKKAAFRNSVAKALKVVSGGAAVSDEGRLQRLERRHLDSRWRRERGGEGAEGGGGKEEEEEEGTEEEEGSEEFDDDDESLVDIDFEVETRDDHNMMNNSLLEVYRESSTGDCVIPTTAAAAPSTGNHRAPSSSTTVVSRSHTGNRDDAYQDAPHSIQRPPDGSSEVADTLEDSRLPSAEGSIDTLVSQVLDTNSHQVLYGSTGSPIGVIDTSSTQTTGSVGTSLGHVTTSDTRESCSDDTEQILNSTEQILNSTELVLNSNGVAVVVDTSTSASGTDGGGGVSGESGVRGVVEGGEGDRGRWLHGGDSEERRRLKKVTFAPDVVDRSGGETLKSPCAPRKRRRGAGEEEGAPPSGHKKHHSHSHHEHRSHHHRHGTQVKRDGDGKGKGAGEGGGQMEAAIQQTLEVKHKKSQFKVDRSSVTFSDVGGCQAAIQEVCKLLLHLRHPEVFARLGIRPPQGFLLHGPPGCGKTLLACAIAGETNLPLIRLTATEVVSGVSGESESTLRELFSLAKGSVPCVLFIDEVDAICPKRETAQREMEKRIVTQLLACIDDLHSSEEGRRVLLIAATTQPESLDPALRRSGRFDREISLGIPDEPSRQSILQVLTRGLRLEDGFSFSELAHTTPGYVGADLRALIREASLCAVSRLLSSDGQLTSIPLGAAVHPSRCSLNEGAVGPPIGHYSADSTAPSGVRETQNSGPNPLAPHALNSEANPLAPPPLNSEANPLAPPPLNSEASVSEEEVVSAGDSQCLENIFITAHDFQLALQEVQPSAKREGFATVPDISWSDVGALEDVREELSLAILAPVRYPQQFASLGLTTPPGILLAGPPGCGKTLLAKAVANESGINFISVKGPELLNMYVGESERAVRQVFQRARNSAPCVIFFDELDALCPKRSEMAETSASARVVNQLLTEMDGLQARRQVFIMAATNRPDIIDPAVLRPGRLDKLVYVGLPQPRDREAILNTLTKNRTRPRLDSDVDLSTLASPCHTAGFSGADLRGLVREAAVGALKEYMQLQPSHWVPSGQSDCATSSSLAAERARIDVTDCVVGMNHFIRALERVKPSVSEKDRQFYDRMEQQFKTAKK